MSPPPLSLIEGAVNYFQTEYEFLPVLISVSKLFKLLATNTQEYKNIALCLACRAEDVELVKSLLKKGARVNYGGFLSLTQTYRYTKNSEVIKLLINNINIKLLSDYLSTNNQIYLNEDVIDCVLMKCGSNNDIIDQILSCSFVVGNTDLYRKLYDKYPIDISDKQIYNCVLEETGFETYKYILETHPLQFYNILINNPYILIYMVSCNSSKYFNLINLNNIPINKIVEVLTGSLMYVNQYYTNSIIHKITLYIINTDPSQINENLINTMVKCGDIEPILKFISLEKILLLGYKFHKHDVIAECIRRGVDLSEISKQHINHNSIYLAFKSYKNIPQSIMNNIIARIQMSS